eukprot:GGOE01014422.1.p1 GENE.GGOE01014422.1~~GGOE01014422.1.p1  ORF type:complete len:355 (-),score=116.56 GGOE01014422.1:302-1246(-)
MSEDEADEEGNNDEMEGNKVEDIIRMDDEMVALQFLRVGSVKGLPLDRLTNCKALSLHRNLLHKLDRLPPNLHSLTDLDLSDNKIKHIPEHMVNHPCLVKLDLSYNNLREIRHLASLVNLTELYLQGNKIAEIDGLSALTNLTLLELGANRIREIKGLDHLVRLTQLFLGKNKIGRISGLSTLKNLTLLSLQNNRIVDIEGLDELQALEELYISENGVKEMTNLRALCKLKVLDLAVNRIESINIDEIRNMSDLQDFWFNDNKLSSWSEVEKLNVFRLRDVYFRHNPIFDDLRYRAKIMDLLPTVHTIDSLPVR